MNLFVIGRKGWLFCNTTRGARASANGIVETAKENGLVPFEYLRYLFEKSFRTWEMATWTSCYRGQILCLAVAAQVNKSSYPFLNVYVRTTVSDCKVETI